MSGAKVFIPPEWATQAAVWVGWPHLRGEWGDAFDPARDEIAGFIDALCLIAPVRIACGSREAFSSAWFRFESRIETGHVSLHTLPAGDIWLRDTGPIFGQIDDAPAALSFQFNGWGGKYMMTGDTMTAGGMASVERIKMQRHAFILEGGAIDLDGEGRLLTTRQCLLNTNRNREWTQDNAETALKQTFGVEHVIWLDEGLANDHTDGHIDNLARFIGPGRVACTRASGADDPNAATYAQTKSALVSAGLDVVEIPSPGRILDGDGQIEPASHLNFLMSNQHLFMPVYEAKFSALALAAFEQVLPDYKIIGLPAKNILSGGGAFHCMTQQLPAICEETR